jgi:hypothetical protein
LLSSERLAVWSHEEGTMPEKYWHVYNYVARQWYETEMGKVEWQDRWYWYAMNFLEDYGQGVAVDYKRTTEEALNRDESLAL